jgi:hypothetical protein
MDLRDVLQSMDVAGFSLEQKMVLLLSASYMLASNMAAVTADDHGAKVMRGAMELYFCIFRAAFPEGPMQAQIAVQEFSKKLGVVPEEMWKERPN